MSLNMLLLLGNPELHLKSISVNREEIDEMNMVVNNLHDTLMAFREKYHAGRAIAAPQIGIKKRLIYLNINEPIVLINPKIKNKSTGMIEVWDDCLCFPELLVKVLRHKTCTIQFFDMKFQEHEWNIKDDLSELLQHEYDHLDGILATQKAIDEKSFKHRPNIYNRLR
ncbi:MAG: peptide deformylase [Bacteroidales bacterium]|nr:peptide deformylase [Bacteroidales bacterium]